MLLQGKCIVVTGASRGLGLAIAQACAEEGATVGLHHRGSDEGHRAVEALRATGATVLPLVFDLRDAVALRAEVDRWVAAAGGLDGWVNNAGVCRPSLLVTTTDDAVREQVECNLVGTILATQAALPHLMARRGGAVVMVGSAATARPPRGQSVYAATKGALEAFTRAVAVEVAKKGVRVHCVRPGAVDTAMLAATRALDEAAVLERIPQRRIAKAAEVAQWVTFLLSDRARGATGAAVTVDGGYSIG